MNPANLVTVLRIVLTPLVAAAILRGAHAAALALFFAAAVTDVVDGALARHFGCLTSLGAYLDPIADKVLMCTVYLCLAWAGSFPWWFVVLVFLRDILILAASGAALAFTSRRKFPPSVWGKLSTFLQIAAAVAWMTRNALPGSLTLDSIAAGLIWPAAAATVWSGFHYGYRGWNLLRTH